MVTNIINFFKIIKSTFLLKKNDEARFRIENGFKMAIIPITTLLIATVFLNFILEMNLIFFEANGYSGTALYREAYYDFILTKLVWIIPGVLIFFVTVFIMGIYISEILLRPFKTISIYCERFLDDSNRELSYNPDFFSDLKLLTSFSEWFFNYIENIDRNKQELTPQKIPDKFTRVHGPIFEMNFFIHYFLFILITSICAAWGIKLIVVDLNEQIIALAYGVLESKAEVEYFLTHQMDLFESTLYVVLFFHILSYIGLAFHLYSRISVPAFAFFSTMRAFSKGSTQNRVHLLGYSFLRPFARNFNRYLDQISKKNEKLKK